MKGKIRDLASTIAKRLAEPKPLIQVVIGPRQVGKTTALKAAIGTQAVYETADYPTPLPHTIIEEWWRAATAHPSKTLAIDEIQKIPGWSEILKKLWDTSRIRLKVVVTGSSALLVEKGRRETLAGRFELIRAEHWNLHEAQSVFGLHLRDYIEFGCYPGAVPFLPDINRWAQYVRDSIVEPALGRDLLQLHPVDQPALLRQIFGVASSLPCQIISLQKLQGQLQGRGTLPTLQHYLQLLADAYLVTGIEKYSPQAIRSRKSSPKLIIHDNGLLRAFRRPVSSPLPMKDLGHYFENLVGARFIEAGWEVAYWRDRDWEVDFVVQGPQGERWAIEVKSGPIEAHELKGLRKFCSIHPAFEPCLISHVGQQLTNIRTLPLDTILSLSRHTAAT